MTTLIFLLVLIELLTLIAVLKTIIHYNFFQIRDRFLYKMGYVFDSQLFMNMDYINKENILILVLLSGYLFGILLHASVARMTFSSMAVSSDTASDLVGFMNYDLLENDIRNVVTISDFIGDHFKDIYTTILTIISSLAIALYFVSFFGAIIGVLNPRYDSFQLILLPFILVSIGVLLFSFSEVFLDQFNLKWSYIRRLMASFFLLVGFIFFVTILAISFGYIELHFVYVLAIGVSMSFALLIFLWILLNRSGPVIRTLLLSNASGILPALTTGFLVSFIAAFFISLFVAIGMMMTFYISGQNLNIYTDLYHLGLIALVVLVCFFTYFSSCVDEVNFG